MGNTPRRRNRPQRERPMVREQPQLRSDVNTVMQYLLDKLMVEIGEAANWRGIAEAALQDNEKLKVQLEVLQQDAAEDDVEEKAAL